MQTFPFLQRRLITYLCESRPYCTLDPSPKKIGQESFSYKTTKRRAKDVSPDIVHYIRKSNPCLDVGSIPKKYLVKTKNARSLYLANPDIVGKYVLILSRL